MLGASAVGESLLPPFMEHIRNIINRCVPS